MRERRGTRFTPFQAGMIALVLIVIGTYLAFAKQVPWSQPDFELKAVFERTTEVGARSPVRIAGVDVGQVSKVERASEGSEAALVTMEIDEEALPIHEDAELKIRPRIFLEGNFFVDVRPGTPSAGELESGEVIPASQTAAPVQLERVLGTLRGATRMQLQRFLRGYGDAIGGEPAPGEDADQDPVTKGETAGESLNDTLEYSAESLRGSALVNDALRGLAPRDLSRLIAGQQRVSQALGSREQQLQDLITNFNVTMSAFAAEQDGLRGTVRGLRSLLERADPALDELNESFPPTRAFAREIIPGVRETAATIDAAFPWIAQTRRLMSPAELQGLVRDLSPATRDLALTTDGTLKLLRQTDAFNRCLLDVVLPTGSVVIEDPPVTTGVSNYREFFMALVGLSSESQNFDGNGSYVRLQPGGGSFRVQTGRHPTFGPLFGNATRPPLGTRPAYPGRLPPKRRDFACHRNTPPDLNSARTGGTP
ncbi:MAG TPA: MlaD family protein [Thermoleophilaceae bacterium]|nr:MlaD family protein [Thermoleophilaceae bacterium]